jgi:hypothetical protein
VAGSLNRSVHIDLLPGRDRLTERIEVPVGEEQRDHAVSYLG